MFMILDDMKVFGISPLASKRSCCFSSQHIQLLPCMPWPNFPDFPTKVFPEFPHISHISKFL